MTWPDLSQVLDIPFAVVGAVATRMYAPERSTRDLDIVVAVENATAARTAMERAGWKHAGVLTMGGDSWRSPSGEEVDILEGRNLWWPRAIEAAQSNRDAQGLPILPFEYLVLMKFQSSRTVDIGDITRVLGGADDDLLDRTRELFALYEPDGLEDLESLIALGKLEIQ